MTLESTAHWSSWFRICRTVIIWDFKGKIILIITILLIIIPLLLLLLPLLLLLFSSLFLYESFEIYVTTDFLNIHCIRFLPFLFLLSIFFFIAQRHRLYLHHSHFVGNEKSCISSPYPHIGFRDQTSQGAWTSWGWSRRAIRGHRPDWGGCGGALLSWWDGTDAQERAQGWGLGVSVQGSRARRARISVLSHIRPSFPKASARKLAGCLKFQ